MESEDNERKCRTFETSLGPLKIKLNPLVTVLSAMAIWGVVIWSIIEPEPAKNELSSWMLWVTKTWTWLYIGTQDLWAVFIIVLFFSKYANVKLGKPDEKPEYGDATYFTMLFAAGVGIGLFYFGVAEPIWHYEPGHYGNRYWGRYVSLWNLNTTTLCRIDKEFFLERPCLPLSQPHVEIHVKLFSKYLHIIFSVWHISYRFPESVFCISTQAR